MMVRLSPNVLPMASSIASRTPKHVPRLLATVTFMGGPRSGFGFKIQPEKSLHVSGGQIITARSRRVKDRGPKIFFKTPVRIHSMGKGNPVRDGESLKGEPEMTESLKVQLPHAAHAPVNHLEQQTNDPAQFLAELIEKRTARVAVIGLGYVGLPLARAFCLSGFPVTG